MTDYERVMHLRGQEMVLKGHHQCVMPSFVRPLLEEAGSIRVDWVSSTSFQRSLGEKMVSDRIMILCLVLKTRSMYIPVW